MTAAPTVGRTPGSVAARPREPRWKAFFGSIQLRYLMIGMVLGVSSPLGLLAVRILEEPVTVTTELRTHRTFYLYDLLGTCLVFGVAGFVAGRRAERLRRGRDRFHRLAEQDELTGLLNVRAYNGLYRRALAHALRYREPLSLLIVDVDQLKKTNDELGHIAGNAVLRHVSSCIRDAKREEDMAARWGGDEFVVLLRSGDFDAAARVADSIVKRVREFPLFLEGRKRQVTVTIGGATRTAEAEVDDLSREADRALLAAKRGGGNQYLAAAPAPAP